MIEQSDEFTIVDRRATTEEAGSSSETFSAPETPPAETADSTASDASPSDNMMPETEAVEDEASADEMNLPDPSMLFAMVAMQMPTRDLAAALIGIFDGHAWRAMGLVADPRTGEAAKDMPTAQLAIDCVQFLLGKVESRLSENERREAQRRLSDLRMNYLAKMRES